MSTAYENEQQTSATQLDEWVDQHGDALYRYALMRVRDEHVAEDLLQETFLGALRTFADFQHKAKLRTWLTSILQRKIVDHYRQKLRVQKLLARQSEQQQANQHQVQVRKWNVRPEYTVERQEFWQTLQTCLQKLPDNLYQAFRLREIEECDPKAICETLEISSQNLAVRVYRARQALRDCLNMNWFMHDSPRQEDRKG